MADDGRLTRPPAGRRGRLRTVLVAAFSVAALLSGCTNDSPNVGPTVPTLSPSPSPTATGIPTVAKVVYIGATSRVRSEPGFLAAELAAAQANAGAFGRLRQRIEVVPLNVTGRAIPTLVRLSEVITDTSVVGAIGPSTSAQADALGTLLNRGSLPFFSLAGDPALSTRNWDHFFRLVVDNNVVGVAAAEYVSRVLHPTCVSVVSDGTADGQSTGSAVAESVSSLGGMVEPAAPVVLGTGARGMHGTVRSIRSARCEAVFFGGEAAAGARLARSLASFRSPPALVGTGSLLDRAFSATAGAAARGTVAVCGCASVDDATGGRPAAFASAFEARFGLLPGYGAAESWDAMGMVIASVAAGRDDRSLLKDFVSGLRGFAGVTKLYTFSAGGNLASPAAVFFYRDRGATWNYLGPLSKAVPES
jgi:branched-chain amino acid transport system substrate-binding protein